MPPTDSQQRCPSPHSSHPGGSSRKTKSEGGWSRSRRFFGEPISLTCSRQRRGSPTPELLPDLHQYLAQLVDPGATGPAPPVYCGHGSTERFIALPRMQKERSAQRRDRHAKPTKKQTHTHHRSWFSPPSGSSQCSAVHPGSPHFAGTWHAPPASRTGRGKKESREKACSIPSS